MNRSGICVLLLINVSTAVGGLSPPQNLSLQTLNTQYVLLWDWADDHRTAMNGTPTFTAQYLPGYQSRKAPHKQNWRTVCADVSQHLCDFSNADLNYFGIYCLRVRANTAQRFSNWTNINFCPDKEAKLGPPSSVKLTTVKGDLEIVIADPLSSTNESMKTLAHEMYYLIQYWKQSEGGQKAEVLKTKNNVVMLSELNGWTWYCVKVQTCYDFYNKTSVFSDTQCTSTEGQTLYWKILLYFLLSLVLCFLLALLVWFCFYKMFMFLKSVFYPNVHLPHHLQELWSDAETPQLLPPQSPGSVCEHLHLISAETDAETDAQSSNSEHQDTSAPSRHGSGDSGFSSTEEDFSHSPFGSTRHATRTDTLKTNTPLHDGTLELCA